MAAVSRFDRAVAQLLQDMQQPGAEWPEVSARVAVAYRCDVAALTDAYDVATAGAAPLTAAELATADKITRTRTGFDGFADMLDAQGGYFPSLHASSRNTDQEEREELRTLANLYDRAQAARADNRRAYRY